MFHNILQEFIYHLTYDQQFLLYFPQTKLVRLFVCLCKSRVRSISFLWRKIESFYFTQRLLMIWVCVMAFNQVQFSKVKDIVRKFVPGPYLLMKKHLKFFLLYINIANDLGCVETQHKGNKVLSSNNFNKVTKQTMK